MQFHHILVPVDLGQHTDRAIDAARDIGGAEEARITLLHVVETIAGAQYDEFRPFYQELEQRAAARLAEIAARFESSELEVSRVVVRGKPAEEIIRFVLEGQVDLIVLASHHVDLKQPGLGWSTLSYKVGILAPCAVLLVK